MCRWNAYVGRPRLIDELLYRTPHGLIDESLHSRMGAETTNGDGFGLGWYPVGMPEDPGRYRDIEPAWNDENLREITGHVISPMFLAHVRAAIGSPVQQTNCHPFRHGRWLFVHNGLIRGFPKIHRELLLAVRPEFFDGIRGTTDSELLFHLALGFGLEQDPLTAMERAVGLVESVARANGVEQPMQGTIGIADGERLCAIRYSSEHQSRTLFVSEDVDTLTHLHPDAAARLDFTEGDRVVVSEPLIDLPGAWIEIPEATALVIEGGKVTQTAFVPAAS